jgi:hypothetical protein
MADFDWHSEDTEQEVVFPSVQAVAVYQNKDGDIVIRQQGSMGEDDSVIIVPQIHADVLIKAIKQAAAQGE